MVDTGQYLSGSDREQLKEKRMRREADPMIIALRKEIRKLRNLQDGEGSEKLKQINRLKKKLFKQMRKY